MKQKKPQKQRIPEAITASLLQDIRAIRAAAINHPHPQDATQREQQPEEDTNK